VTGARHDGVLVLDVQLLKELLADSLCQISEPRNPCGA
jgi:hypothetical protein